MYYEDDITFWDDGAVTYRFGYDWPVEPSACEWIVPGFWHLHE